MAYCRMAVVSKSRLLKQLQSPIISKPLFHSCSSTHKPPTLNSQSDITEIQDAICRIMEKDNWPTALQTSIRSLVPLFDHNLVSSVLDRIPNRALEFFQWVEELGFKHDRETHHKMINILCTDRRLDDAKQILLGMSKKGLDCYYHEDMFVLLIHGYAKSSKKWDLVKNCVKIFLKMEELGVVKTVKSYNCLLEVLICYKKYTLAGKYFNKMLSEGIVPVKDTYTLMINGYVKVDKMEEAEKLLMEMKGREIEPLLVTYNSMINGYAKVKKMEDAEKLKAEMMEPNLITYNTMINGYARVEKMEDARKLVWEMKGRNFELDLVTNVTMIKGYVVANRVDDGLELVEEMRRKRFGRKVDVNLCLGILKEDCDGGKMCEAQRSVLQAVEDYVERVDLLAMRDAARELSELASRRVVNRREHMKMDRETGGSNGSVFG